MSETEFCKGLYLSKSYPSQHFTILEPVFCLLRIIRDEKNFLMFMEKSSGCKYASSGMDGMCQNGVVHH